MRHFAWLLIVVAGCGGQSAQVTQDGSVVDVPTVALADAAFDGTMADYCNGLVSQWQTLMMDESLYACSDKSECAEVGSPETCDCAPTIDGCGTTVNLATYRASAAGAVERQFFSAACLMPELCDCGPEVGIDCVNGFCTHTSIKSCFPTPDAGRD